MIFGIQGYCWYQVYDESGAGKWAEHFEDGFAATRAAGFEAIELGLTSQAVVERVGPLLAKHGLTMPSTYSGGKLHEGDWRAVVESILQKARWGRPLGVKTVVVNPDPIAWDKPLDKDDAQLRTQAAALQALGEALSREGIELAYHTHHMEMRHAAREFHHMMRATDAAHVGFCLDTHWVFRGAGDSQVAMDDILGMYASRVRSFHIRQSRGGIWTEVFEPRGDIDYAALAGWMAENRFDGPVILEQCFEKGTELRLEPGERFRRGLANLREMFPG